MTEKVVNGFIELERILEGVQSVSEGKTMVLLVAEAYGVFTVKTNETKQNGDFYF